MKIYTKTGDDGTTALFDGTRVRKDNDRVAAYGEVDELNAFVGWAASLASDKAFQSVLYGIQKDLFALGSKLANPSERKQKDKAAFGDDKIKFLEGEIDRMETSLQPMTNFILPGGTPASAALHVSRTVCRRVERMLVSLSRNENLDPVYVVFVNRLSDYLFVAARYANHLQGCEDVPW